MKTSKEQHIQELQYSFPYHYIPKRHGEDFSQVHFWSWGAKYLGGLERVLRALSKIEFDSVVDIGCGDGRFLGELSKVRPDVDKVGIDYSDRAIAYAKAFNPGLDFRCVDLTICDLGRKFDIATMIEVLEHIPLGQIEQFLLGVAQVLKPDGVLVLTVPHSNKPVSSKHFQHFTSRSLRAVLSKYFEVEVIEPFDRERRWLRLLSRAMGFHGNNYILTNKTLNNFYFRCVLNDCLRTLPEEHCGRLLAVARVKS